MDCQQVQDQLLESLIVDEPPMRVAIDAHLTTCPACAAFAARQARLDAELRVVLGPPILSTRVRAVIRERIRHERRPVWSDVLPDVVHFASCGAVTIVSLVLLPFHPTTVLAVAAAATMLSHAVLTAAHGSLDAAGDGSESY